MGNTLYIVNAYEENAVKTSGPQCQRKSTFYVDEHTNKRMPIFENYVFHLLIFSFSTNPFLPGAPPPYGSTGSDNHLLPVVLGVRQHRRHVKHDLVTLVYRVRRIFARHVAYGNTVIQYGKTQTETV